MTPLEDFERALASGAPALAPNGAVYQAHKHGDGGFIIPVVHRTIDGETEKIVGWDGRIFGSHRAALQWAITDGRHAGPFHTPLSQRRQLA